MFITRKCYLQLHEILVGGMLNLRNRKLWQYCQNPEVSFLSSTPTSGHKKENNLTLAILASTPETHISDFVCLLSFKCKQINLLFVYILYFLV